MFGARRPGSGYPKVEDQMSTTVSFEIEWMCKTPGSSKGGANVRVTGEGRQREQDKAKSAAARMYPDAG